jgi:tRNA acetyltransferase TAN1
MEVIGPVAELFDNTVDLENPDWVVLIEIMGKMTGVSIVPADSIFKVQVERAALIFSS